MRSGISTLPPSGQQGSDGLRVSGFAHVVPSCTAGGL
jgi:hypothetical protein